MSLIRLFEFVCVDGVCRERGGLWCGWSFSGMLGLLRGDECVCRQDTG